MPAPADRSPADRHPADRHPAGARSARWFEDAVIYQLHVRSFADSDADGTGDFDGLTSRLGYLVDLGVDTLWLLPFFVSPLRDDGYDIADYTSINPAYGDMASFRRFLRSAHAAGLRVVIELVMNHTSDAHHWFQRARRAPRGSRARNYYVWSDTADRYPEARVIFQDFETSNWTWDPVAKQYYWHRFYSHQPDLNFESPDVRRAMIATLDRWFKMGVDGVRLDAVPYLFEADGTNCENLPETHEFLRRLRRQVDEHFPDRMLLAEANQWPEDAVAYFGDGDECHMAFHFPLMPRLFMAVQMESRSPVLDILEQTPAIPPGCQWAMFLRNHDELTLEMVTDEERDYMYRRFAGAQQMRVNLGIRRRLGPLLEDDRRRVELMNALLFSLPGTPIIYYGDEIGMGDNVYLGDRDAVRTPMQWNADRNAGFSQCDPQRLFLPLIIDPQHHFEAINVDAQRRTPTSLWWWTRRLIALRRRHLVFGRGQMVVIDSDNPKVLTFIRTLRSQSDVESGRDPGPGDPGSDDVLVVANLSRHAQRVAVNLTGHAGAQPIELFGQTRFEPVGDSPYRLTLGPHDFYWLRLAPRHRPDATPLRAPPIISLGPTRKWTDRATAVAVVRLLPEHLVQQRWFRHERSTVSDVRLVDVVPIGGSTATAGTAADTGDDAAFAVLLTRVELTDDEPRQYVVPLEIRPGARGQSRRSKLAPPPVGALARTGDRRATPGDAEPADTEPADAEPADPGDARTADADGRSVIGRTLDGATVRSASESAVFVARIARAVTRGERRRGTDGELVGRPLGGTRQPDIGRTPTVRALGSQHQNAVSVVNDRLVVKIFRRVEPGHHPEVETLQHLAARGFRGAPTLIGTLEHRSASSGRLDHSRDVVVASVLSWVHSDGDARSLMLGDAARFYEWAAARSDPGGAVPADATVLDEATERAASIGQQVAALHHALADSEHERFAPEPFTRLYQRSLYQAVRAEARSVLLPLGETALADAVLAVYDELRQHVFDCDRIRVHGDLQLASVLLRGADLTFIDFEGNVARALGERSIKRSALSDVAIMIRSFHHVAGRSMFESVQRGIATVEQVTPWATRWADSTATAFVTTYLAAVERSRLVPPEPTDTSALLRIQLLRETVDEVRRTHHDRPERIRVPLDAVTALVADS